MKDRKTRKKAASGLRVVHRNDAAALRRWAQGDGQALLPMLELLENAQASIDELMNEAARAVLEELLVASANKIAGEKHRGKAGGPVLWHGSQRGQIQMAERKLSVTRPRLRTAGATAKEVAVPAYERLQGDARMGARVRDIVVKGVSMRKYREVLPEVAGTVGVSKSAVSRRFIEASAAQLAALNERPLADAALLAIYIDGIIVDGTHILAALGVDERGKKALLGLSGGSSENAQVVKALLTSMRERGLAVDQDYLFVIDGGKALRSAIEEVFGSHAKVQRCRTHKLRNVLEALPKEARAQTKSVMNAAYKLDAQRGMDKIRQQAKWLQAEHADAAASMLEGLEEVFTVNKLALPPSLMRCLCTTNIIENPNGSVRTMTHRVKRWRDQDMALRWVAAGFLEAEKTFRRIDGVKDLWVLAVALGRQVPNTVKRAA
ncbi:MAG: IS256 family transposase [Rubrivivax sp.]|nr:IS256 family transposase [Burkholderiales bacterium]MCW5632033.1 IS256 family transposase [Rubrivivax sp.]